MKTLKLAVVALSLGFFAASCGGSDTTKTETVDSTVVTEPQAEVAPTPEAAPVPTGDTTIKTTTTTTTVDTLKK